MQVVIGYLNPYIELVKPYWIYALLAFAVLPYLRPMLAHRYFERRSRKQEAQLQALCSAYEVRFSIVNHPDEDFHPDATQDLPDNLITSEGHLKSELPQKRIIGQD